MHCSIPAHNPKYMAYDIFLESGLVLIMVELALNSNIKRPVYSHEFFRALTFSTRKYMKFSFIQHWQKILSSSYFNIHVNRER